MRTSLSMNRRTRGGSPTGTVNVALQRKAKGMFRGGLLMDLHIHSAFYNHAISVAKRPWVFVILALVLVAIPMPFLASFTLNYSTTRMMKDGLESTVFLGDTFGLLEDVDILFTDIRNAGVDESILLGNQWTKASLDYMWQYHNKLFAMQFAVEGAPSLVSIRDLCQAEKPLFDLKQGVNQLPKISSQSQNCDIKSVLQVWDNYTHYQADADPLSTIQNAIVGEHLLLRSRNITVPLDFVAYGVKKNNGGNITNVVYWHSFIQLLSTPARIEFNQLSGEIEVLSLKSMQNTPLWNEQLGGSSTVAIIGFNRVVLEGGNVTIFGYWILMIIIYCIIVGFKGNSESRVSVLLLGILNAILSIACGFAIVTGLELEIHAASLVAAGIIIAIAVDDVFVIVNGVNRVKGPVERRFAQGIGEAATAILMTTVTDVIVFGYGMFSVSYSSRVMALFLVLAVSIDFLLQLTFLAGVFIIDMRLASEGKWCLGLCCPSITRCKPSDGYDIEIYGMKQRGSSDGNESANEDSDGESEIRTFRSRDGSRDGGSGKQSTISNSEPSSRSSSPVKRMRRASAVDDDDMPTNVDKYVNTLRKQAHGRKQSLGVTSVTSMGSVKFDVKSATGSSRTTSSARSSMEGSIVWSEIGLAKHEDESVSGKFFHTVYSKMVLKKWFHVVAMILLIALVGVTVYGLFTFEASAVVSRDLTKNRDLPMVRHRLRANLYFPELTTDALMVNPGVEYTNETVQSALLQACDIIKAFPVPLKAKGWDNEIRCWFTAFHSHLTANNMTSVLKDNQMFLGELKKFVAQPENMKYRFDIMWESDGKDILTSRLSWTSMIPTTVAKGTANIRLSETILKPSVTSFMTYTAEYAAYSISTEYYTDLLIETGIVAGSIVTLVSAIFLINPFSSLLVTLSMLLTSVGTFTILDIHPQIELNLQMMFVGVFAIGFGIDFTAHVILAFNTSGGSVEDRIKSAMSNIGSSVFHGALSASTIGFLLPFIAGFLQVLISIFFTAVTISFTFALVIVPVLLQYLRPPPALRDLDMQTRLVRRRKPLEVSWELAFEKQRQELRKRKTKK